MNRTLIVLAILGNLFGVAGIYLAIRAQRTADDASSEAYSASFEQRGIKRTVESLADVANDHDRRIRGVTSDISDAFGSKINSMQRSIDDVESRVEIMELQRLKR